LRLIRTAVLLSAGIIALAAQGAARAQTTSPCNTQVWAMFVPGTLAGFSDCKYDWTLQKTVLPTSVTISTGSSQNVTYTIKACRTGPACRLGVRGQLHLLNETCCPAQNVRVTFVVTFTQNGVAHSVTQLVPVGTIGPNSDCPTATSGNPDYRVLPFEIPLCQAASCDGIANVQITAMARLDNQLLPLANPDPSDNVSIPPFATDIDANAVVTDSSSCPTGFTCTSTSPLPKSLTSSDLDRYGCATISYMTTFQNVSAPCGQNLSVKNTASVVKSTNTNDVRTASATVGISTGSCGTGCTFTLGYWKNHPNSWPVTSLTLGSVTYSQAQLLAIFDAPVRGNGLISLAHQLIAAKLNVLSGASSGAVSGAISAADSLIGSKMVPPIGSGSLAPSATSSVESTLDNYNNGIIGPGHCPS
jgi:hypothetical protein